MPHGGHFGLWKPTPKDIFRSRWKRFYKKGFRGRHENNNAVDQPGPYDQPRLRTGQSTTNNPVPEPWRLRLQGTITRPGPIEGITKRYMTPAAQATEARRDYILRVLDSSHRGLGTDSGAGRVETIRWQHLERAVANGTSKSVPGGFEDFLSVEKDGRPDHVPSRIYNVLQKYHKSMVKDDDERDLVKRIATGEEPQKEGKSPKNETRPEMLLEKDDVQTRDLFPVRRVYELEEEFSIVWQGGMRKPGQARKEAEKRAGADAAGGADRGNFPFIDEKASLVQELALKDILKVRHRTNSRRHPKWQAVQYEYKRRHQSFLRRRATCNAEIKSRMGVIKTALES